MKANEHGYGIGDASYKAAGGLEGLTRLVDDFYDNMAAFPDAQDIRRMHPEDLTESRRKLAYFLSGWLGGPKIFTEHYGPIRIPHFHKHLPIGEAERDAWLYCMKEAIAVQPYAESFKEYLLVQLRVPAERVRQMASGQA